MPEISRFFGIVIRMYYADHEPPHCHASYGTASTRIRLAPVAVMGGDLPPRALRRAVQWASLPEAELLENWRLLRRKEPPLRIAPLE
jgi:hypothetical protein